MPGWISAVSVAVGIDVGTVEVEPVSVWRGEGSRGLCSGGERGCQSVELNSSILDARRACIAEEVTL